MTWHDFIQFLSTKIRSQGGLRRQSWRKPAPARRRLWQPVWNRWFPAVQYITSIVTSLQSLHHLNHCTTSYITLTLHHLSKMRSFAVAQGFRPILMWATDNTIVICRLRTLARSLHHFNNASPQWLHHFKNTSPQSLHHLNRYITSIVTSL